jgi:hypothetical protein
MSDSIRMEKVQRKFPNAHTSNPWSSLGNSSRRHTALIVEKCNPNDVINAVSVMLVFVTVMLRELIDYCI